MQIYTFLDKCTAQLAIIVFCLAVMRRYFLGMHFCYGRRTNSGSTAHSAFPMGYYSAPVIVSTKKVAGPGTKCRRAKREMSQVWARSVAGRRFSAELRRKSATGGKYRRRSAIFCRPATLLHATSDVSPLNLRHFGPRPATTHPINGSVPATSDVSPPNLRRSPCHRNISYPNTGKIRFHHGR